ncbi:MAG TPA: RtcB family protein, partial [Candidatus Nanopelagicaceae bacterium]|nr:RtcB family protein [Candidatus Nanopelagicaceae bacterium]
EGHDDPQPGFTAWLQAQADIGLDAGQLRRAAVQFGTLGSGNHFVEVAVDERDRVWILLHSGSRGIGNQLAQAAIREAKLLAKRWLIPLEDPDLAYLVQGDSAFDAYLAALRWSQAYAAANRVQIQAQAVSSLLRIVGKGQVTDTINCHHNYTEREHHLGRDLWITRKGAIRARVGDRGIIPGSMGTASYIVGGLGNAASYQSCSHGAGRRMSRTRARKEIPADDLRQMMRGREWLEEEADHLVDEAPAAYKDIDQVMADQADLVKVVHRLSQVLNYKGF